jgi:hypothetical protein
MLSLLLPLAGCTASASGVGGAASVPQSISYETGPCFGACPVYSFTIGSDGQGSFEGKRFTKVIGQRAFTVAPDRYRAFAAQLAPLRPAGGTVRYDAPPNCERMATDLPSASVTWRGADGSEQSLYFYYGCDMEKNRAIGERLRAAPGLLPLADFIKG